MAKRVRKRDLRLPQELIDAIVNELRNDSSCLVVCSKTAKTFRVPCQRWIFREMVIHSEESGYLNTYQRASDILNSSPDIEPYIREISTVEWPAGETEMRAFELILHVLRSVQRLMISNTTCASWTRTISPGLTSAILNFTSLSSLDRLHLVNIADVPSFLLYRAVASVRVLELDLDVSWDNDYIPTQLLPPQLKLEHLILSHSSTLYLGPFISMLKRDGYLKNTQHMTLSLHTIGNYEGLFASLPSALRHLEINCGLFREIVTIPKGAGLLQILKLSFYIGFSRAPPHNLDYIVSKLPEFAPLVERLILIFKIMPSIPEVLWVEGVPWPCSMRVFWSDASCPNFAM
ncbi:hypothetical protein K438DRAFT_1896770 [Mycena galopus ATCC 62051]|nr:hypothetical protein K438DRAFT_1896770 [Mycena galopus ATCC 62051]